MKTNRRFRKLIIFICIVTICIIYFIVQNNWIQVEHIEMELENLPQELDGFRIAHLSDVHLPQNASSIENIVQMVKEQEPDIIVMTGDIIDRSADIQTSGLNELCEGLSEITDVYAVTGNHEQMNGNISEWKKVLTENGVRVIDNTYIIIKRETVNITIMGLADNTPFTADFFENTDVIESQYKVLLAHRPELWNTYASDSIRPDLVLSGHAHGGQLRIPFVGGLIAPDQGFFPKYTSGLYVSENDSSMVVSRGLGNSIIPIRINNRPHLPIITLTTPHN